jgi:hypothetical protein
MPSKARVPTKQHLSRAAKDMHSKSPKVRKEAAEVMALAPRATPTRRRTQAKGRGK